eukprot:sb/3471668/
MSLNRGPTVPGHLHSPCFYFLLPMIAIATTTMRTCLVIVAICAALFVVSHASSVDELDDVVLQPSIFQYFLKKGNVTRIVVDYGSLGECVVDLTPSGTTDTSLRTYYHIFKASETIIGFVIPYCVMVGLFIYLIKLVASRRVNKVRGSTIREENSVPEGRKYFSGNEISWIREEFVIGRV